jgi:hypothetical protein
MPLPHPCRPRSPHRTAPRRPCVLLHGTTDRQVTPEQADTLAAAIRSGGNGAVTVRLIPATNHLLLADTSGAPSGYGRLPSKLVGPTVLGPVVDWLVTQFDAAAIAPPARGTVPCGETGDSSRAAILRSSP